MIWRCILNSEIKYIIFDLDDTLYQEKEFVLQAMREVAKFISKKNNKFQTGEIYNRLVEILEIEGRGKIFNQICKEKNIDIDVMKLVKVYRATKPKLAMYPDAIELIRFLKKKEIKIGIITDGDRFVQNNKIEGLHLKKYVDTIIVTDEYNTSKPDKKVFEICLKKLGATDPAQAVYIGDNPLKDFLGAKKIGMNTIRIVRKYGDNMKRKVDEKYDAEYTIKNMEEVIKLCQI